jgi:FAD/FMN-containing dehydrogenase
MIDRRPAVIVVPMDTADVVTAVRWAGDQDLPISIRGGGHSVAGHSVGEGSLMLDLGELRGAVVDPVARTADVGGGALLEDLDRATTAHGLAAPSGTFYDTGVAGLTLTGGLSFLLGAAGLACDALIGAELVDANGIVHDVDGATDPELLWALRGGGGNFGVVTRLRFGLMPLTGVYGGSIAYAPSATEAVLHRLFEVRAGAPDELTLQAFLTRPDGAPDVSIHLLGAWIGDPDDGPAVFRPFRDGLDIVVDDVVPRTYLELQAMNGRMGPTYRHYWKGQFVRESSPGLEDAILASGDAGTSAGGLLIEAIHGMAHRIPEAHAAFGARAAIANVSALAIWEDPAEDDRHIAWARATTDSLVPFALRGDAGYLNYAPADESANRVARAYGPERFARLQAVKRRTDPANRFRFNANIPPA